VVEADLIVGADGFRSTVRDIEAPEIRARYSGYVAWRGVMDETELSPAFRAETFANFSFCFAPGSQFIGYPLIGRDGSVEAGRRRYSFLWYYHVEDGPDLDDVLTDAEGRTHTYSIPPPLIRPEHFRRLQDAARNDLPPQFAEVVARASTRFVSRSTTSSHAGSPSVRSRSSGMRPSWPARMSGSACSRPARMRWPRRTPLPGPDRSRSSPHV
jgi:2-polyprenyl-6-methoxyphenol hydroxylase-like FAD-dependent oxidoreductase